MINNTDLNLEDETTKISIEKEEREKEEDTSNFETKASDKINDTFSYYETRSIADLISLISTGRIDLQPEFQRSTDAWSITDQSKFIYSIVRNYLSSQKSLDYS